MKTPEDIRLRLERLFQKRHPEWLRSAAENLDEASSAWPLEISLGSPTCRTREDFDALSRWIRAWQGWLGEGQLCWQERTFRGFGTHHVPARLMLADALQVARAVGQTARWETACQRSLVWLRRWPQLKQELPRRFSVLADYSDEEFHRLTDVLDWMTANPASGLYLRQLPIPDVHTKWIETRKGLVMKLVAAIRGEQTKGISFYRICGLRPLPRLVRIRVLDPELREYVGGLADITAPVEELATLHWNVPHVLIVENLQTGLALGEIPNTVVIMKLGNSVNVLGRLPWVVRASTHYWGDIDTHGIAILDHARKYLPQLQSVLMDEPTLLRYKSLWNHEMEQYTMAFLTRLSGPECELYGSLKRNDWGNHVRLEQERIPWEFALSQITAALHS